MIAGRLRTAARNRLAHIRSGEAEGGFALVFVLLVTAVITAAVATTLAVTTPNISNAKKDRDQLAATAAAQAGIDDFLSYLAGQPDCRSTSRVCTQALGATSDQISHPDPQSLGTDQTFTWRTDSTLTADYNVRVRATGMSGSATRKLVADIALSRGILSFGYYTDYESQSPSFLYNYYAGRGVYLSDQNTYDEVDADDTSGRALNISSPTTVQWAGPPTTGSNPLPASICGEHWYADTDTGGRFRYGDNSVWGERATVGTKTVQRAASCDVVFTTGMTIDGPVYSRDALLISDQTVHGVGPIFKQPVYSLWGYRSGAASYANPVPPATPWRRDVNAGGAISSTSPYSPATATFDLQLPKDIGSEGLPADHCVYYGPTRVKLIGGGKAHITSPLTTSRAAGSDNRCYPAGSLAGGIVDFEVNYQSIGNGAIYVRDSVPTGDADPTSWPSTTTKSTYTADDIAAKSVMYLPATSGGAATPDQPSSSAAPDSGCSSNAYKATAGWPCAWSSTSSTYTSVRTNVKADLAGGACLTGTTAARGTCLQNLLQTRMQPLNTGGHPVNYGSPSNGDVRYVVSAPTVGTPVQGTPQNVGTTPTPPLSSDSMFTSTSTAAREAATKTPTSFTVTKQTYACSLLNLLGICIGTYDWRNPTTAYSTTVTQSDWAILNQASGASYFPNTADVTKYNTGTMTTHGKAWPGDLYVEGTNAGRLSLLADNDVVVTGDVTSPTSSTNAVDIVAGNNVRNYHPVKCADQTATDITKTDSGWCPNDITGLYRGADGVTNNGVLTSAHPAKQYTNLTLASGASTCKTPDNQTASRCIDAAIFALNGSYLTDNYNRGDQLGPLTVNGGIYQSHRGANGVQWEYQTGDTRRATSGYSLQYHYVDLQHADLPYTPPVTGDANGHIWTVVSISPGGSS